MSEGLDRRPGALPTSRYAAFAAVALAGVAADLASKSIIFSWPEKLTGKVWWVWEGYFGLQTSLNEGALFGLGYGHVPVFAAVSVAAAVAIPLWLFVWRAAQDLWLTLALGAVMAGVLGNLYDRLGLHAEVWPDWDPRAGERVYAVRDWVLWQLSDDARWPNFNIADALLVTGTGVMLLRASLEAKSPVESPAVDSPGDDGLDDAIA